MHKSLLIDSDILIDHLRKEKKALDFLDAEIEKGSLLFLSIISRTEIYAGIRKGEEEIVSSLFEIITPLNIDTAIADTAGEYLRRFSKSHTLNIGDAVIAATASEMVLSLVTRNVKHYPMKDISVLKPY
ncbi:MAG: type II toxin-antitoxin system VapC family toxin [Deltaproteobacteria bacterium]|nr:type II toxin-antitoxin system VapC family toxin [Deltaproteobacteria bacterium]